MDNIALNESFHRRFYQTTYHADPQTEVDHLRQSTKTKIYLERARDYSSGIGSNGISPSYLYPKTNIISSSAGTTPASVGSSSAYSSSHRSYSPQSNRNGHINNTSSRMHSINNEHTTTRPTSRNSSTASTTIYNGTANNTSSYLSSPLQSKYSSHLNNRDESSSPYSTKLSSYSSSYLQSKYGDKYSPSNSTSNSHRDSNSYLRSSYNTTNNNNNNSTVPSSLAHSPYANDSLWREPTDFRRYSNVRRSSPS